jgi:hypothetical protein
MIRLGSQSVAVDATVPWLQHALGGMYLRAGQFRQSLACLDESDRTGSGWHARVLNDVMRAIVHIRLGDLAEARRLLVRADQWYEIHLKPESHRPFGEWTDFIWVDWLAFKSLRREAEMLLLDACFPSDAFGR